MMTSVGAGHEFDLVADRADAARQEDADVHLHPGAGLALRPVQRVGRLPDSIEDIRAGERNLQVDHGRRASHPVHVPLEQERRALVGPHHLVHALAIRKPWSLGDHRLVLPGDSPVHEDVAAIQPSGDRPVAHGAGEATSSKMPTHIDQVARDHAKRIDQWHRRPLGALRSTSTVRCSRPPPRRRRAARAACPPLPGRRRHPARGRV